MLNPFSSTALRGREAMVFAASQGLGEAAARQLAAMGADVLLLARSTDRLEQVATAITDEFGVEAATETLDITDDVTLSKCLDQHLNTDILVTNCGGPPVAPFEQLPLEEWDKAYRMIVRSAVLATQKLVPGMADRGWGRVVMIASSVVVDPMRNFSISNALRKSLKGLVESLAEEYASRGVAANLVCPGLTDTARVQSLVDSLKKGTGAEREAVIAKMTQPIACGRMAHPEEIAAAVGYLASDAAGFIQGQALLIDGGQAVNP